MIGIRPAAWKFTAGGVIPEQMHNNGVQLWESRLMFVLTQLQRPGIAAGAGWLSIGLREGLSNLGRANVNTCEVKDD